MLKKVRASFYRTGSGSEPVREWIKSLSLADRKIIGADIATVEFGWPGGMPLCRSLGKGIWEVRSDITDGIARVLFFFHDDSVVLLHGCVKKSQKIPDQDLQLASKRMREVKNG